MSGMPAEDRWSTWELPPKRLSPRDPQDPGAWRGYELREGVESFLQSHPELRCFIREAGERLRGVFGEETELALKRFVDPESPVESAMLFLLVKTPLDAQAAQALLDRFDETWWLDNAGRADHLLQVSIEFV